MTLVSCKSGKERRIKRRCDSGLPHGSYQSFFNPKIALIFILKRGVKSESLKIWINNWICMISRCVLEWRWQYRLIVVMLLLLAEDLQLEKELLLLQEPCVRRVHGGFAGLVLLVWGNVLVVLEFLHPGLGLFTFLAAALLCGSLLLTLLFKEEHRFMPQNVMDNFDYT